MYKVLIGKPEKKGFTLKDRSVDAMIGSELILKRLAGGVCGVIQLAQGSDRWRAVVGTVMSLWVLLPRSEFN